MTMIGAPSIPVRIMPSTYPVQGGAAVPIDGTGVVTDAISMPLGSDPQPLIVLMPNLAMGNNTIYTVPTGYAFFVQEGSTQNPTSGAITHTLSVVIGGTSYIANTPGTSIAARNQSAFTTVIPGDGQFVVNASAGGLVSSLRGFLVSSTHGLKPIAFPLANGNNVIYTCPNDKTAQLFVWSSLLIANISFFNSSLGTRIYGLHLVPASGSPTSANKLAERSVANNASGTAIISVPMVGGESLYVVSDGAGTQICYTLVVEMDA